MRMDEALDDPGASRIEAGDAGKVHGNALQTVLRLQRAHAGIDPGDSPRVPGPRKAAGERAALRVRLKTGLAILAGWTPCVACVVNGIGQHGTIISAEQVQREPVAGPQKGHIRHVPLIIVIFARRRVEMTRELATNTEGFPIAGVFTISRGSRTEARVVTCTVSENGVRGQGECVPYPRYGESEDSVLAQIEAARKDIANGISRADLVTSMPAGAARNAVDCALWDLEAKLSGQRASATACAIPPRPLQTAYTISLAAPEEMAAQARAHATRPLLKVKLGGENDAARIHAVAGAAPDSRLIVDANEGWTEENIRENMLAAAEFHVALIEQPLPAGKDGILRDIPHPVPICADESVHTRRQPPRACRALRFRQHQARQDRRSHRRAGTARPRS